MRTSDDPGGSIATGGLKHGPDSSDQVPRNPGSEKTGTASSATVSKASSKRSPRLANISDSAISSSVQSDCAQQSSSSSSHEARSAALIGPQHSVRANSTFACPSASRHKSPPPPGKARPAACPQRASQRMAKWTTLDRIGGEYTSQSGARLRRYRAARLTAPRPLDSPCRGWLGTRYRPKASSKEPLAVCLVQVSNISS